MKQNTVVYYTNFNDIIVINNRAALEGELMKFKSLLPLGHLLSIKNKCHYLRFIHSFIKNPGICATVTQIQICLETNLTSSDNNHDCKIHTV